MKLVLYHVTIKNYKNFSFIQNENQRVKFNI